MAGKNLSDIFLWLVGAFIGTLVLTLLGVLLYRWLKRNTQESDETGSSFTLADLRRLRDQGLMTPQEYDRAKARLIAAIHYDPHAPNNAAEVDGLPENPPLDSSDHNPIDHQELKDKPTDLPDDAPSPGDTDKPPG